MRQCSRCNQPGHYAPSCKATPAEAGAGRVPRTIDDSSARTARTYQPIFHRTLAPDQIPYHCTVCGYWGTLNDQTAHRATHKRDHKISEETSE